MLPAIQAALARASGSYVTVGVQKGAGVYKAQGSGPPPTVAQVALWNEYGTVNTPARPFIRPAFSENQQLVDQQVAECLRLMAFEGCTVERALSRLGLFVQLLVQNKIKSNPGPELTGSWDEPAGHGSGYLGRKRMLGQGQVRLIATGLLLRSIQYQAFLSKEAKQEVEAQLKESQGHASAHDGDAKATRAHNRAQAHADKHQNQMRRAAHKEKFAEHKKRVRAAKAAHPGIETATRHANGRYKTRAERQAWVPPKE